MDIDLSKFHQIFFDDSIENINRVEQILLKIDLNKVDQEDIDSIFRCAHSIKGSSGMFSFKNITQFTHTLENYLDAVRKKEIFLSSQSIELLLKSLDFLKKMIEGIQNNKEINYEEGEHLENKYKELIQKHNDVLETTKDTNNKVVIEPESNEKLKGWEIEFRPHFKIFQNGDDPLRIIRALQELGSIECDVNIAHLVSIEEFFPDECYLEWKIKLTTTKTEKEIRRHAFEWVEDESKIVFKPIEKIAKVLEKATMVDNLPLVEKSKESVSIRVAIEKIDDLINMVGELIITQSMLTQIVDNFDNAQLDVLKEGLSQLKQNCRELQENVLSIRMLPISNIFNRFPRLIHDLSKMSGKQVELKMTGETTELDKTVLEKVMDPLVHLVRNAIDHGFETPQERLKAGKPKTGVLELKSYHQGSNIIIEVIDDGHGLDQVKIVDKAIKKGLISSSDAPESEVINDFIFNPGFSTAENITDISGRGVGLDVVRNNIESLGGRVTVTSTLNVGTTFTICLPLTLAIIEGQLVRVTDSIFIIPLTSMIKTIQVKKCNLKNISNLVQVYQLHDRYIPIIRLYEIFNMEVKDLELEKHFLVIIELNQQFYGILIDELLQLQQVVIKNIENNYTQVEGISGATILGDGKVALILDVAGIVRVAMQRFLPKNVHYLANKFVA